MSAGIDGAVGQESNLLPDAAGINVLIYLIELIWGAPGLSVRQDGSF